MAITLCHRCNMILQGDIICKDYHYFFYVAQVVCLVVSSYHMALGPCYTLMFDIVMNCTFIAVRPKGSRRQHLNGTINVVFYMCNVLSSNITLRLHKTGSVWLTT